MAYRPFCCCLLVVQLKLVLALYAPRVYGKAVRLEGSRRSGAAAGMTWNWFDLLDLWPATSQQCYTGAPVMLCADYSTHRARARCTWRVPVQVQVPGCCRAWLALPACLAISL